MTTLLLVGVQVWLSAVEGALAANSIEAYTGISLRPARTTSPEPADGAVNVTLALPRGNQQFGGIPFDCDRPVALFGLAQAQQGQLFPQDTGLLPVEGLAAAVQLLHGLQGEVRPGIPVMTVEFHYADGQSRSLRIAAGVQVPAGGSATRAELRPLADPDSETVWPTALPGGNRGPGVLLTKTRLPNPRPEAPLTAFRFVSLLSDASPLLVAATLDRSKAPIPQGGRRSPLARKAETLPETAWRQPLTVQVSGGGSGSRPANGEAFLSIFDGEDRFLIDRQPLSSAGQVTLHYPPGQAVGLDLVVRAPGWCPLLISQSRQGQGRYVTQIETNLVRGTTGGGVVEDESGRPVSGALVTAYLLETYSRRSWGRTDVESARTDAQGRWSLTSIPPEAASLAFEISHPRFQTRRFTFARNSADTKGWALEQFTSGRVPTRLQRAPVLMVNVRDQKAAPIKGAKVSALLDGVAGGSLGFTTDDGSCAISSATAGEGSLLLVEAEGLAPATLQALFPKVDSETTVTLRPTRLLRGVVRDQDGSPIEGAEVKLESWNETALFRWTTLTDEQGRFFWTNGVPGRLRFRLGKSDYSRGQYNMQWSGKEEMQMSMMRPPIASGTVVDAETEKPIRDFRVLRGYNYGSEGPLRWERYNTFRGRNGSYSVRLQNYGSNARLGVMIEAPGYLPVVSGEVKGPRPLTNSFRLQRARGLNGVVVGPHGEPVGNVQLILLSAQETAYLDRPGQMNRSNDYTDQTRSDPTGRFEFQPRLFAARLVAVHETGCADVSLEEFQVDQRIRLVEYGRIEGVFKVGTGWKDPMSGVRLETYFWPMATEESRLSGFSLGFRAIPDAEGRFVFEKVPAGLRQLALNYKFTNRRNANTAESHLTFVAVRPGSTSPVVLGGGGRQLHGRVRVVGDSGPGVDWLADVHYLTLQQSGFNQPLLALRPEDTPTERLAKRKHFDEQLKAFLAGPGGRKLEQTRSQYALVFQRDGSFQIDNVLPGRYQVMLAPYEHINDYSTRELGRANHQVTVPEGARENEPYDLGTLEIRISR